MNRTAAIRNPARGRAAKKTMAEVHRESMVISENVRMLMARYRDTQAEVAGFLGIGLRTYEGRLAAPWEFRMEELEGIAQRYDLTVGALLRPIRFDDD